MAEGWKWQETGIIFLNIFLAPSLLTIIFIHFKVSCCRDWQIQAASATPPLFHWWWPPSYALLEMARWNTESATLSKRAVSADTAILLRRGQFYIRVLTCPGGRGCRLRLVVRPLQARITVLWRCRWISASSWFHNLSCSTPFMSRPRSWICWILNKK